MNSQTSELMERGTTAQALALSTPLQPPVDNGIIFTANNPIENYCTVDDPIIIIWKGASYHTQMRGAKLEVIASNLTGQKSRLKVLPETSYILADMPKNYAKAGFELNAPMTMRFLRDGIVYTLRTALLRVHSHPPLLVLEYSEKLEFHNMRSDERIDTIFPARIIQDGGSANKIVAVLNISPTGIGIGLDVLESIKVGTKLNISFTLPNSTAVDNLAIVVRKIGQEGGKYLLGTKLLGYEPAITGFLRECADCRSVWSDAMSVLGKDAAIEFARKNGQIMVRGWKTGENGYLLVEKPRGQLPPLPFGAAAVVRMEKKGVVYGMAVTYKELLRKTNLCYFTYQDDVIARKLRDEERVQCLVPAKVHPAGNHTVPLGSGIIVDLSKGGFQLITRAPMNIEVGNELSANFCPGGMGFIERQNVRVMRVGGHSNRFEYAFQFVDLDKKYAILLEQYFAFCTAWAF